MPHLRHFAAPLQPVSGEFLIKLLVVVAQPDGLEMHIDDSQVLSRHFEIKCLGLEMILNTDIVGGAESLL